MKEYTLEENRGHIVSFAEFGNPDGPTIISFHGGPGSRSRPEYAERFDLEKYRVILFDQRGCGKSTPMGEIANNTTDDLISDVERIREKIGVEKWFVSGASWGACLALVYAIRYPERVRGLLLAAVFLADRDTVSWFSEDTKGAARFVPEVWEERMKFFQRFNITLENQNRDILVALESGSNDVQKEIAAGVKNWENNLFSPEAEILFKKAADMTETDVASVRIFAHYEKDHEFLPDNYIIDNVATIANIPTMIVHGRYDINCPLDRAYALHKALGKSTLVIANSSGHKLSAEAEALRKIAFTNFLVQNS